MKILVFGVGLTPYFIRRLKEISEASADGNKWYMLLPDDRHLSYCKTWMQADSIYVISEEINKILGCLTGLEVPPFNFHSLLDSEKYGLKQFSAVHQDKVGIALIRLYQSIIEKYSIDVVLFPIHIENFFGRCLAQVAIENDVKVAQPIHLRYFKKTVFVNDSAEPSFGLSDMNSISDSNVDIFLKQFRNRELSVAPHFDFDSPNFFNNEFKVPSRFHSFKRYIRFLRSKRLGVNEVRIAVMNLLFPKLRNLIWRVRGKISDSLYDINSLCELPPKFIYYPLQYTPESSINVPAPYFIDQMRVIDLLRFSLPPGYVLLVKEHPSCKAVRPLSFIRSVRKKSGVRVINSKTDSRDIIARAAVTVSVTGTSALEAFLANRPSITLGEVFFSKSLGGVTESDRLKSRLSELIESHVVDESNVRQWVAGFLSIGSEFNAVTPGSQNEFMCNDENAERFYKSFKEYCKRLI